MAAADTRPHGRAPALQRAAERVRVPRRARREPGARLGRRRDRPRAARGEREHGRAVRDQPARRRDRHRGRGEGGALPRLRAPRGDLRAEHDLAELHALAHRRAATSQPGDEILVSSLDHDGGVAPWLELAHDRTCASSTSSCAPDTTLDYDDLRVEADRAHARRRVRLGVERDRHDRRRGARLRARPPRRRARLGRRRALRRARADRRARDRRRRAALLALQVLRAAPRHGLRPRRAARVAGVPTRRARRRSTRSAGASRPARCPTSCSPASTRRSTTSHEIGGMDAIVPYERALGERFLATLPECVTVYGLPTLEGRVPTFLVNVDGRPRRARSPRTGRARDRRLGARQLVLAEPLPAGSATSGNAIRVGFIHYNTAEEVDRFVGELTAARLQLGLGVALHGEGDILSRRRGGTQNERVGTRHRRAGHARR